MSMVSFAQNGEDVVLRRLFDRGHAGFYIDVGASHPSELSVTRHFYDSGWSGINIEPGTIFSELNRLRPRDINIRAACSNRTGTIEFCEFPPDLGGWSTCDRDQADAIVAEHRVEYQLKTVPVRTLKDVYDEYVDRPIDFLKIDVEGHEQGVLEGADWDRCRPLVVLVECFPPTHAHSTRHLWESLLIEAGYLPALFDGLNQFYLREDRRELLPRLSVGANVMDDFIRYSDLRRLELIDTQVRLIDEQNKLILELKHRMRHQIKGVAKRIPGLTSLVRRLRGKAA